MIEALINDVRRSGAEAVAAFGAAAMPDDLKALASDLLGKKGPLAAFKQQLGSLTPDERKTVGQAVNEATAAAQQAHDDRAATLNKAARDAQLAAETLDLTEIISRPTRGHAHLVTQVWERLEDVFIGLGFTVAEGPEAETDFYNF
jgi:phenylalanyl-tRNA synthetase alpha chain